MSTEQIRKTLRSYQRAVTADPTDVDLRQKLASYLAALGYTRQAAQELELCAKLLAARGDLVGAISCGKRLLRLDPGRTDILLFLTRHYAERAGAAPAERVVRVLDPRVDHDLTPPVPTRAVELETSSSDTALGAAAATTTTAFGAPTPHEAATRVVRMPLRDPGLESIELTVVSLGDDDDDDAAAALMAELELDEVAHPVLDAALDGPQPQGEPEAPPHLVRVEIPNAAPLEVRPSRLPTIPLFSSLEPAAFMQLLEGLEHRTLPAGTRIDRRSAGAALQILVQGELHAWWQRADGARVDLGPIEPGGLFGDLDQATGGASEQDAMQVEVVSDSEVLVLPRARLETIAAEHPSIRHRLQSLHHKRLVRDFLAASDLFDSLGVSDRELLARRLRPLALRSGDWLGRRGDPTRGLYLVREGRLESLAEDGSRLALVEPGTFFGVHSLRRGSVFLTDLRALAPTTLLVLATGDLELFLEAHPEAAQAFEAIAAGEPPAP